MSRKLIVSTFVLASMTALAAAVSLNCQGEVNASASTGANTPTTSAAPTGTPDTTASTTASATPPQPAAIKATKDVTLDGQQVKLPGEIEYESGKDTLKDTDKNTQLLAAIVGFMTENPGVTKLQIEGHTDNQKPKTGSNMDLSQGRANGVVNYLVAKGIKKDRLVAVGYGDSKPKGDNKTDAGRATNRRTEFHITEKDGQATGGGSGAVPAATTPTKGSPNATPPPKK